MDIIKAIKSGKRFSRKNSDGWFDPFEGDDEMDIMEFSKEDLLADDWEIEEEKITISKSDFESVFNYNICTGKLSHDPFGEFMINRDCIWHLLKAKDSK